MQGEIKMLGGMLYGQCIRIVYIEGQTDISVKEFLNINPQFKVLGEIEPYHEAYKYLFEIMVFDKTKFNIIYSTKDYIYSTKDYFRRDN